MSLENRNFNTQVIYNIKDIELKPINHVITTFIEDNLDRKSLWFMNVIQYIAIFTILDRNKNIVKMLKIKEHLIGRSTSRKRSIISRNISFITLITNSQNGSEELTKQLTIKAKLKRWYGKTKQQTFYPNYRNWNMNLK